MPRSHTMEDLHHEEDQLLRLDELLDKDDDPDQKYNRSIVHRMSMNQARRKKPVDIFETIDFFRAIDNQKDRDELKRVLITEQFKEGDVLFNYMDPGDKMYVVMEGEITISFPDYNIPP